MPLNKNGKAAAPTVEAPVATEPAKVETSSEKLLGSSEKLSTDKPETTRRKSSDRDYDAEARGKVACVAFGDALKSPGIAQLPFKNLDELLQNVTRAADAMYDYTFRRQNEK